MGMYCVFGFFMVAFYTSNLRAHLVVREIEKLLDTDEDVAESGKMVYIPKVLHNWE